MASIIIFSTLWGIALKEWSGVGRRTKLLVAMTLFVLVSSTVIVGYGNYIAQPAAQVSGGHEAGTLAADSSRTMQNHPR
jgi:hypothetical protein